MRHLGRNSVFLCVAFRNTVFVALLAKVWNVALYYLTCLICEAFVTCPTCYKVLFVK